MSWGWQNIKSLLKKNLIPCIAAFLAVCSMWLVPPNAGYLTYIDSSVICLLFCLMAVVAGFQQCNIFQWLAQRILSGCTKMRRLILLLVLLPFFCSMLITNDVALILFVPFTIFTLQLIEQEKYLVWVIVLQTVAANLGSIATPIGNPQNLFIYTNYTIAVKDFFAVTAPLTALSLLYLVASALLTKNSTVKISFAEKATFNNHKLLILYSVLFVLCLLTVFRVIHYGVLTLVVFLLLLLFSYRTLLRVDYGLLITFVCFFILSGNLSNIPLIYDFLTQLLAKSTLWSAFIASQFISNVPAAILLSGFTANWQELLIGVDIGGLGTPIASLASLISLKIYLRSKSARPFYYLAVFTLANIIGILLLLPITTIF